jgi:Flp pilus assembly protein TadD
MSGGPDPGLGRALLWSGALAAITRIVYLTEHLGSTFFGVAILDEAFYDAVARALLEGGPVDAVNPGFRPLLYPAFLALAYLVGGAADVLVAVVLQHLCGVGTVLLVAALAARLGRSTAAGLLAGCLYALAGPPLYFEGERLVTTLFTFLVTAVLWLVIRADGSSRARVPWLVAGAGAALAAQARPNALVFLAVFVVVGLARIRRRTDGAALAGPLLWAPLGLGAGLVIAGWLQAPLLGGTAFPGGSGGVNFYLGNARDADGRTPVQDRGVITGDAYRDSVEVFARQEYEQAAGWSAAEPPPARVVSRYWLGRGWQEIRDDPSRWLGLMARKAVFLLGNEEIPNNKSYRFVLDEESRVLGWMPVRWWLLLALAPLGAWGMRRRSPREWPWVPAWALLYGASLLLFFVNARFRIPVWPALSVLAGLGLVDLAAAVGRGWRSWAPRAAIVASLAALSLGSQVATERPHFGRDHLFRSMAARQKGLSRLALEDARRAAELLSADPAAWIQLGLALQDVDQIPQARRAYLRARELAPGEPRPWNNLGVLLDGEGRPAEAYRHYRAALAVFPSYGPALVNVALLELRAGRVDLAATHLEQAAATGYGSVSADVARARILALRGREAEAVRLLESASARAPETVLRLVEELERPLAPDELGL